jgi:hypothetical protein
MNGQRSLPKLRKAADILSSLKTMVKHKFVPNYGELKTTFGS